MTAPRILTYPHVAGVYSECPVGGVGALETLVGSGSQTLSGLAARMTIPPLTPPHAVGVPIQCPVVVIDTAEALRRLGRVTSGTPLRAPTRDAGLPDSAEHPSRAETSPRERGINRCPDQIGMRRA